VDEIEREENQKNHVRDFLRDTFYKNTHEINTKDTKDLVIHTGKSNKDKVAVIIEAKRPGNKGEMISMDKPNSKALQELVLYYLRERIEENNIDIKYCVITNVYEWYIIESSYFEKLFFRNKDFVKSYEEWRDGKKVTKDTNLFYNDIVKPFLDELDEEVVCTYFDIRDYEKVLKNEDKTDDKNLIALFKVLSPIHLLKVPFADDSNKLDDKFYKELLYIIGLEEVKDKSKLLIQQIKNCPGSLLDNAIHQLKTEDCLHKVTDVKSLGDTKDEQYYNVGLQLCITWMNRILFLKLLEGQLINYHRGNKDYKFLNTKTIHDYDELYKLFHQVLARTTEERTSDVKEKYKNVPYLNSSLFEINEIEDQTIKINSLDNSKDVEVLKGSILKTSGKLPSLDYLFKFLDSYDFSSEGVDEIQEENRTLINASVLGKIFEKINGYKDGAIFTPGFITMYMCRQSLRLAVVQKFNDTYKWKAESIDDLKNYLSDKRSTKDILEVNGVINSLHICDPAVGSGHFLVSALNELICIKSELGILSDEKGVRVSDHEVTVENDELIVSDENGDLFQYTVQSSNGEFKIKTETQRIQKTLFHEKQTLIENCLFGVDINPNSVKICRLRLWIELLKNTYYKEKDNELETLPNIDINIKCGNSLISRFPLDADLSKALKSIKYNIDSYKGFVNDYKNAKSREVKRGLQQIIDSIKVDFRTEITNNDPKLIKLNKLSGELFNLLNQGNLFDLDSKQKKTQKDKKEKLESEISKLAKEIDEIKNNVIYNNSFEWRFEFPEVLNENGDFEGFDVVIGNPPYIQLQKDSGSLSKVLESHDYKTFIKTGDIYMIFYERGIQILKENGIQSLITSSQWMKAAYGKPLRKYLLKFNNLFLVSLGPKIFENATVDTNILTTQKGENNFRLHGSIVENEAAFRNSNFVSMSYVDDSPWLIMDSVKQSILFKFNDKGKKLSDWDVEINRGILTGLNEAFIIDKDKREELIATNPNSNEIIKPILRGREINKYITEWDGGYVISTFPSLKINIDEYKSVYDYLKSFGKKIEQSGTEYVDEFGNKFKSRKKTVNEWFETQDPIGFHKEFLKEKIIWKRIGSDLRFSYSGVEIYCLDSTCILTGEKIKYLTALLNSKVCQYQMFEQAPRTGMGDLIISVQALEPILVHYPSEKTEEEVVGLVDQILERKKQNKDTSDLENKIDQMVYKLYNLTEEEIKIVEGSK